MNPEVCCVVRSSQATVRTDNFALSERCLSDFHAKLRPRYDVEAFSEDE
jgi:hypothetical protein